KGLQHPQQHLYKSFSPVEGIGPKLLQIRDTDRYRIAAAVTRMQSQWLLKHYDKEYSLIYRKEEAKIGMLQVQAVRRTRGTNNLSTSA
ncbi:hypothetical protein ACJX0J_013047, partial [Zea mays]